VAIAVARWSNGRMRVAVSGFGTLPLLALDRNDGDDIENMVDKALYYSEDLWASADYRRVVGKILASRLVSEIKQAAEERAK
jgi:hypothetical protein